ncbi:hypothetical protein, partial [Litoreibacter sp.]|uniref:hypothetical protein n=1 Tax=Litoreibacter sp. TaxID=1969459 RepID=UPI003297A554
LIICFVTLLSNRSSPKSRVRFERVFCLPYVLLIASCAGIVVALVGRGRLMGDGGQIAVPFGPFLAFGFFVVLVAG